MLVRNHVLLYHFLVPKLLFLHVKFEKFSGGLRPPSPPPGALPLDPAGGCAPRPLLQLARRRVAPPRLHGTQPARFARCQDRKPQSELYHRGGTGGQPGFQTKKGIQGTICKSPALLARHMFGFKRMVSAERDFISIAESTV